MIGVFDSGLGGLTALREIRSELPKSDIIYFGDTARIPYGTKSKEVIDRYSLQDCTFLNSLGVDILLAACGTVSSNSLSLLKSRFDTPVFGVIEGAAQKAAETASKGNGRVLVLGTCATVESKAFEKAIYAIDSTLTVYQQACPMFVPLAESWNTSPSDEACRAVANEYLSSYASIEPSAVILGCTHYPLLSELISSFLPKSELISSGKEAARLLSYKIDELGINTQEHGSTVFYTSDDPAQFKKSAERFFGSAITQDVYNINIESVNI